MTHTLKVSLAAVLFGALSLFALPALAQVEFVEGNWTLNAPNALVFSCGGGTYAHTLDTVSMNEDGSFTGEGTYDANAGYTWDISGYVNGSDITFTLVYTGLNSGYTLHGVGTINPDGSVDGTTDGNCQTFSMPENTSTQFFGNHGQYVRSQENKKEAAQSRIGMPTQSKGHTK